MRDLPIYLLFVATALAACKTEFYGSPKFPNGVDGCRAECSHEGLEFGAFVYSGEFATSCVCQAARAPGPSAASSVVSPPEAASTAAVSVAIQRAEEQRAEEQQRQFRSPLSPNQRRP